MGPMPSVLYSPINGESQKRAVVLHRDHKMVVAKGFRDSGLVLFLNKNLPTWDWSEEQGGTESYLNLSSHGGARLFSCTEVKIFQLSVL